MELLNIHFAYSLVLFGVLGENGHLIVGKLMKIVPAPSPVNLPYASSSHQKGGDTFRTGMACMSRGSAPLQSF